MDIIKSAKPASLKGQIMAAAEKHNAMHRAINHKAMNSAERRAARHAEMEAQLKLNNPLGKGVG